MNEATGTGGGAGSLEGEWADAIAEETRRKAPQALPAGDAVFPLIEERNQPDGEGAAAIARYHNIPVQLTVELGRTRLTLKELCALTQGSVVELDGLAGQPLDVKINGYPIAQGQVVQAGDKKFGIRLTEIIRPAERIQRLGQP